MYTVQDYASLFIEREKITSIPVNVKKIARAKGYIIQTYTHGKTLIDALGLNEHAKRYDSFTCYHKNKCYIFLADGIDKQTEQRLIGHELGHIEMHMSMDPMRVLIGYKDDDDTQDRLEKEADEFGAFIRAPLCLLEAIGVSSILEIMKEANLDRGDASIIAQALLSYRSELTAAEAKLAEYRRTRRAHLRRERSKMMAKIAGVTSITLIICFGVFCLTASVFSGLVLPDLIGDPVSSAASSHEASAPDPVSSVAESSATSQKPADQPPTETEGSQPSSQAPTPPRTQPAVQQPQTHYTQPAAPSSSAPTYTPPASSTAPSSSAPSSAPPTPSSMPNTVPVKPEEPLITITPYTRYYWTGGGAKYHLFADCYHIRDSEYQIESGLLADAKAAKKYDLCADCSRRNKKG